MFVKPKSNMTLSDIYSRMKRTIFFLLSCVLLCGCVSQAPNQAINTAVPTSTPTLPPRATPTIDFFDLPNSYVPPATPTFIPIKKIVQDLEVISPENIGRLALINRWGKGYFHDIKISPDHTVVAVATSTGVYLYRSQDLTQIGYLNISASEGEHNMKVDFSPDGKLLAVAGYGVTFWDVASQTRVGVLRMDARSFEPRGIKFTPDGRHVAINNRTYTCQTGGANFLLYTIEGYKALDVDECGSSEGGLNGYYRMADGHWFYFFTNPEYASKLFPDEVIKLDLYTDQIVDVIRNSELRQLYDVSSDGKWAAYLVGIKTKEKNDYVIRYSTEIVDMETGQIKETLKDSIQFIKKATGEITWQTIPRNENGEQERQCNLAVDLMLDIPGSKDKLVLANPLQVLDVSTCTVKKHQNFLRTILDLPPYYLDANGGKLIIPSYESISVLDINSGELIYSDVGDPRQRPGYMSLNLDGSRIVYGNQEISPGPFFVDLSRFVGYTLRVIDPVKREATRDIQPNGAKLEKILPYIDKSFILVEDNLGLHLWNLDTGEEERSIPMAAGLYQYPDGQQYLFVENNRIHLWDAKNWKDLLSFHGGQLHYVREISPISKLGRVAIRYTLTANPGQDMYIAVFDIHAGKKIFEVRDDDGGLELFKDQPFFVHNRMDGYIELWSTDQDTPINTFLGGHIIDTGTWIGSLRNYSDVFLSPDAKIFITSKTGLEFWDVKGGQLLAKIGSRDSRYFAPLFSPDGRFLIAIGDDGTFRVWGVKRE